MGLFLGRKWLIWIINLLRLRTVSLPNDLTNRWLSFCRSWSSPICWHLQLFSSKLVWSCLILLNQCWLIWFFSFSFTFYRLPWFKRLLPSFIILIHHLKFIFQLSFQLEDKLGKKWIQSAFWLSLSIFFILKIRHCLV